MTFFRRERTGRLSQIRLILSGSLQFETHRLNNYLVEVPWSRETKPGQGAVMRDNSSLCIGTGWWRAQFYGRVIDVVIEITDRHDKWSRGNCPPNFLARVRISSAKVSRSSRQTAIFPPRSRVSIYLSICVSIYVSMYVCMYIFRRGRLLLPRRSPTSIDRFSYRFVDGFHRARK